MLLDQLKSQLQRHHLWAQKSLGQNFLIDEQALDRIVEAAELTSEDHVVEVGAGTGLLTTRLASYAGAVTALEYDEAILPLLCENLRSHNNVNVFYQDALKFNVDDNLFFHSDRNDMGEMGGGMQRRNRLDSTFDEMQGIPPLRPSGKPSSSVGMKKLGRHERTPTYKVVANIPYYITSPLIKHFLTQSLRPSLIVLLIQKEVAEKVASKGKGKTVLTIETQVYGEPEVVGVVRKDSFFPVPKVDSAILRLRVFDQPKVPAEIMPNFIKVLHAGFSQKRKKLTNSLSATFRKESEEVREWLKLSDISDTVRAEELVVEDWLRLTKTIYG